MRWGGVSERKGKGQSEVISHMYLYPWWPCIFLICSFLRAGGGGGGGGGGGSSRGTPRRCIALVFGVFRRREKSRRGYLGRRSCSRSCGSGSCSCGLCLGQFGGGGAGWVFSIGVIHSTLVFQCMTTFCCASTDPVCCPTTIDSSC